MKPRVKARQIDLMIQQVIQGIPNVPGSSYPIKSAAIIGKE